MRRAARAGLASLLLVLQVPLSLAAGYAVRPVSLETSDGNGALTVSNPGDRRIYIEAAMVRWGQSAEGVDMLDPAPDAIVSPPAAWIEPQAEYRFRFRVARAAPGREVTYRLVLTQVPSRDELASGRVVVAVTQSIPVFVEPESLAPPSLFGVRLAPRQILLNNTGGRRLRIVEVTQDGRTLLQGLVGYALGGSKLRVNLPADVHPGSLGIGTDLGPRLIDLRD